MPPLTSPAVSLPSDTRLRQRLEAAHDYIKGNDWNEAVRVLQDLIDAKEDQFLPSKAAPADGKPATRAGGIRAEALRLVATLPPKGRETYNTVHGPKARALLKEAIDRDDVQVLTQVVQRYLATEAGAEAAERLGTYHLDRGHRDLAGRCFAALLGRPDAERLPPLTLYKAAVACRLANDKAHEEQAWKALAARAPDGLTVGGQVCELDRLRAGLARLSAEPAARGDWPLFRADPARTGRGDGDVPLLEPLWSVPTVLSKQGPEWIDAGLKAQERANRLVLPGFYPLALPGRVVYRSHAGLHALDPAGGRELWRSWKERAFPPLSLDGIAADSGRAVHVRNWLQAIYGDAFHFPVEGSALGCLSADGERVYAVEDLAVPPPTEVVMQVQGGVPPTGPRDLRPALFANRLQARALDTGELVWEKGGPGPGDLQNCFFLGAPLPVAGRLYALVDKDGEVRLACLDPASGAVHWTQRLGVTPWRMALDPCRRLRGVQMTYAGGLLLCPTDAGAVFAFDPFARSLAWAYLYPSKKLPAEMGTNANLMTFNAAWRESAPAVADGKVVFTSADSDQVHCVSLRDGQPLWQVGQGGSAYLAGVFRDKVLLVGVAGARALSLKDGREAWARPLGVPSGQGAAVGNVYYLPLKHSTQTGGPGVAALNADSGNVLAFAQSRGGEVPGNLAFCRGMVLSQTATTLTAYPQLKTRLKRIDELLASDPHNPRGLTERGTLRLDQGDAEGALADLRAALGASPAGEPKRGAQARLHEALRQAVQRDFAAREKYLAEFETSCRVPVPDGATAGQRLLLDAEQRRREANYLLVLARGRESQGRVAEALAAYADLYARAGRVPGSWNGPEVGWLPSAGPTAPGRGEAATRPESWVHGRVTALVTGAQRAAAEQEAARRWRALAPGADLEGLGRFVTLFGAAGPAGLEARLAYAERLAARPGPGSFLEAELYLLALERQREAPQVAARALETLARLLTERGQTEDALFYYRRLAEEFGPAPVCDGMTGADFLKGLASDRRFLPLLDDPWAGRKYRTEEVRGLFPPRGGMIWMEPEGEAPPCLRRQRLAFDLAGGALRLFDRNTGAELWSQTVTVGGLRQILRTAAPQAWIPYRAEGHLAVVTLGHMAYGIDLLGRRLLWARDLDGKASPVTQISIDESHRLRAHYGDGVIQPLGRVAPLRPAGVCLTVRGQLAALDPLRGDLLWTMALSDPTTDLLADDTHVYLVEGQLARAPTLSRAVSLGGGVATTLTALRLVPDDLLQAVGRNVLLPPTVPGHGRGRLTLYDALAGKDVWSRPLAPGTLTARSEVPYLMATVGRDGKVHVYDLRRRAELFHAEVDADHLRGVNEVRLFQDDAHYYLMLNRELRARDGVAGPALPNAVGGLRTLPAHGHLYAFHRGGSLHWASELKAQCLVLEHFEESPLLLFSALVQRADPRSPAPMLTVTSLDKHNGKVVWRPTEYAPITSPVHRVQIDPAAGAVELITQHRKLRHTVAE
jgi:outer membrane protein assembly factor BamB